MGNHSRTNIITKWLNQCSGDMDNNNVHLELDQARVGIQWTTIKDILVTINKEGRRDVRTCNHPLVIKEQALLRTTQDNTHHPPPRRTNGRGAEARTPELR